MNILDELVTGWLAVVNVAALLAFGLDKWRAGRGRWRVSEWTLVLLGALGGWPGGWLGMKMFRHKTAKRSFQFKYALGLLPLAAGLWAWWRWR